MDIDQGRSLLRSAQFDRGEGRKQVEMGQATIESSQLIIQGILRRFPELAAEEKEWEGAWEPESADRPRGSDAVLQMLQVLENKWYSISALVNMLAENDWLPESSNPPNAVRAAVERLVKISGSNVEKGKANDGTVVYRYHEPEPPPGYNPEEEEPF